MKQAHTVTVVTSQEDTPLKDVKDEAGKDSKRKTTDVSSPQIVFELAEKLDTENNDAHVPEFLKVEKDVTDVESVSRISQSMASE